MTRAALILGLALLGCARPGQTRAPRAGVVHVVGLPDAIRPEAPPVAADQAFFVGQYDIGEPSTWAFEPGGELVAAEGPRGGCGIWSLGGVYLGEADASEAGNPCEDWPGLEILEAHADLDDVFVHDDLEHRLEITSDHFVLSGPRHAFSGLASVGRYWSAAFSPDGQDLAILAGDPVGDMRVEVWSLAKGSIRRVLNFEYEGTIEGTLLDWSERSLFAFALVGSFECESDADAWCENYWVDREHDYVVNIWPPSGDDPVPEFTITNLLGDFDREEEIYVDPEQRSIFVTLDVVQPRSDHSKTVAEMPLHHGEAMGLSWEVVDKRCCEARNQVEMRRWFDIAGPTFVAADQIDTTYAYYGEPSSQVESSSLSLRALPDRSIELVFTESSIIGEDVADYGLNVWLAAGDVLLADVDMCRTPPKSEHVEGRDGEEPLCTQARVVPPGCAVHDARWDLDELLLTCGARWLIVPMPESEDSIDLGEARELARGTRGAAAMWGPSGLAIVTADEGLRVFSGDARAPKSSDAGITQLYRPLLGEELDLALVGGHEGLRVLDLASGALGPALEWKGPIEFAAFAPDRRRLALAGDGEIALFERSETEPRLRIESGPIEGMAFRQDGEVLFVGRDDRLPELALDPATGELVMAAQLTRDAFERIASAELDPTWRWAIEEDGTILRTLDGQAIELFGARAAAMESGWTTPGFRGYVVRIGPGFRTPLYELAQLADQLERPDLIEEFFAGKPLPRPSLVAPAPTLEQP